MNNFDTAPQPIECTNCGGKIMVRLSDFKKDSIITCTHCAFKMQVDDDYYQQIQKSLNELKRTIANFNKKLR